jgi:hypothetical protein
MHDVDHNSLAPQKPGNGKPLRIWLCGTSSERPWRFTSDGKCHPKVYPICTPTSLTSYVSDQTELHADGTMLIRGLGCELAFKAQELTAAGVRS